MKRYSQIECLIRNSCQIHRRMNTRRHHRCNGIHQAHQYHNRTDHCNHESLSDKIVKETKIAKIHSLEEYNSLLKQAARNRNPHLAESLILSIEQDNNVHPSAESYNALIEAWAFYSGNEQSVIRAERWFHRISEYNQTKSLQEGGNFVSGNQSHTLLPNTESYNLLLTAISRSKSKNLSQRKANAEKASRILELMKESSTHKPNTESYNRVMQAWVKCGQDIFVTDIVMKLLKEMESSADELSLNGSTSENICIRPNTLSYSIAMNAWGLSAELKSKAKHGSKNTTKSWKCSQFINDIEHAESLLNYMHSLFDAGVNDVRPDTQAYNILIAAWCRTASPSTEGSPLKAESVLRRMIELSGSGYLYATPDVISYNTILQAWVKVRNVRGALRSEWWLRRMIENGVVSPNTETYNIVIKGWSIHDPYKAEEILNEMIKLDSVGDINASPSTESFSICIGAFVRYEMSASQLSYGEGCLRAKLLLEQIVNKKPNHLVKCSTNLDMFNNVLKAAAISRSSCFSLTDTAFYVLRLLKKSRHNADCSTYRYLMQAVLKSDHEKTNKKKILQRVLDLCQDDGQLSKDVVRLLTSGIEKYKNWAPYDSRQLIEENFSNFTISPSSYRNLSAGDRPASRSDLEIKS